MLPPDPAPHDEAAYQYMRHDLRAEFPDLPADIVATAAYLLTSPVTSSDVLISFGETLRFADMPQLAAVVEAAAPDRARVRP